jgi:hypothetical protein
MINQPNQSTFIYRVPFPFKRHLPAKFPPDAQYKIQDLARARFAKIILVVGMLMLQRLNHHKKKPQRERKQERKERKEIRSSSGYPSYPRVYVRIEFKYSVITKHRPLLP